MAFDDGVCDVGEFAAVVLGVVAEPFEGGVGAEISEEARSRINTVFVTSNFIGCAIGSAAATIVWSIGSWTAVVTAEAALCMFGFGGWALGRRGALVVPRTNLAEQ